MTNQENYLQKLYWTDIGCLTVYCNGSIVRIQNQYGDGSFKCYLFEKDFALYQKEHEELYKMKFNFIGIWCFDKAKVLGSDLYDPRNINNKEQLFELNGWYSIYVCYGKVYFVKENM